MASQTVHFLGGAIRQEGEEELDGGSGGARQAEVEGAAAGWQGGHQAAEERAEYSEAGVVHLNLGILCNDLQTAPFSLQQTLRKSFPQL